MNKSRKLKLHLHKRKSIKNKLRRLLKKKKEANKKQIRYRRKKYGNPLNNLINQIKEQKNPTFNKMAYKPPIDEIVETEALEKQEFKTNQWLPPTD